jgi:hypothetical protein
MISVSQSFKIYEVLNKHFKNEQDAKIIVSEIENIIDTTFKKEKDVLATKEDIYGLQKEISNLQKEMSKEFRDQLKWMIILMVGIASLIITILKLS